MDLLASPSISFPDAIEMTKTLVDRLEAGTVTEADIEAVVTSLVQSHNGARGFFVGYLTNPSKIVDKPSEAIIRALKSAPDIVSDLLVKNLAMSAAMTIVHRRNNDLDLMESSAMVCQRSDRTIEKLESETIVELLEDLLQTIVEGKGSYQDFLERWGYDREQLQVIERVTKKALNEIKEEN
jgi:hypothetical protein